MRNAFSLTPPELDEHDPWLSEYTLQRTRRFRALDVWTIVHTAGRKGLASAIAHNNDLARLLLSQIQARPELELSATGPLSIVRFRYLPPGRHLEAPLLDQLQKTLARELQHSGKAFLTSTRFQGQEVLRACLVNYLTTEADIYTIVDETIRVGNDIVSRYV